MPGGLARRFVLDEREDARRVSLFGCVVIVRMLTEAYGDLICRFRSRRPCRSNCCRITPGPSAVVAPRQSQTSLPRLELTVGHILRVGHIPVLSTNGRGDRDAVWVVSHPRGPKEPCTDVVKIFHGKGQFWGLSGPY